MISNIEKVNEYFQIPICFNKNKMELSKNVIDDLELIKTVDPSCNSIYSFAFQPKTSLGKKVLEQFPQYYTNDTEFLKDTQSLLKTYKKMDLKCDETRNETLTEVMEVWDEIKNDTGFKEKYQFIDWPMWEFLNHSESFLQVMSIYNLASPVISLFVPFIILIIPFFIIKMKGLKITIGEYVEVLKIIASNHAIGRLFTEFNNVQLSEKFYLVVSAAFYIFSIYQNILTCYRFHNNMKKIHSHLKKMREYIEYSEIKMYNILLYTENLKTYNEFNEKLKQRLTELIKLKELLNTVTEYKLSIKKVGELGSVLKSFYTLYDNKMYYESLMFSFGFHGYLDNIEGFIENMNTKKINAAKFNNKKSSGKMKKLYYPALMNTQHVKNSVKFKKNLIITGPNASGKTTILKSVLINTIITQQIGCGFYESATMCTYKYIHCYLNIPDTSGRDSLFQAEARRCKDILDIIKQNPKEKHFCVFDELYSGTNPEEAVIGSTAFMEYLVKNKCVTSMLTTHFINVCEKLKNNKNLINYHMDVTKQNNKITYKYLFKEGISKIKGGLNVLYDMNYPKEIIENTIEIQKFDSLKENSLVK
jgi:energy-coupling factor transporter ATP-binding protein EcfA2